jgi:O-antigen/teichoic acid export membrane protein
MSSSPPDNLPDEASTSRRPGASPGLTRHAVGGMFWTSSGTSVQAVIQLLVLMALGRLLSPAEFGLMGAANVVVALSQIVSRIGVGPAIIQRRDLETLHVRVAVTLSCGLGLVLGAVVYFGAPTIAAFYRIPDLVPVLRVVAFLFPLDGLNTVGKSLLSRDLRFRRWVTLDVGSYIIGYAVVGVALAWGGYGVWALVVANLAQVSLRTVAMYAVTRHSLRPSLDVRTARELLSYGFGMSLSQITSVVSQQGDNFVVGRWLGAAALGVYGRAYSLMVMPATGFGRIVNRVLFPLMAQVQDEPRRLASGYERACAVVALLTLPISAFLWVTAPEFIPLVLGPKWTGVIAPFRLFSISLLFRMSSRISETCVSAAGRVYSQAVFTGAYAALVIVGAIIGQRWGVGGVAICVSVAMLFNWLSMAWLARSITALPDSRFVRAHAPGAALAVVVGLAAAAAAHACRTGRLGAVPTLLISGLAAAGAGLAGTRLFPDVFLGHHGRWAVKQVEQMVRRVRAPSASPAADGLAMGDSTLK